MASEEVREYVRSSVVENRITSREKILSSRRKALEDVINIGRDINNTEVNILANKLKIKSAVQVEDLALLKLSFVQSANNIVTFLRVKGGLHGLVRELSSGKSDHQLLAAECFCNLALGDAKSCILVAKAAGPYLITLLSGCNYNLIAVSVWALGNLAGSDEKTCKVIHSQGFLGKILQLITEYDITSDISTHSEIQQNSLMALAQFLRVGNKLLTTEEVKNIGETISSLKNSSCKGLRVNQFLLSCSEVAERQLIRNKVHLECLKFLYETNLSVEIITEFTSCVRTIANLVAEPAGDCALEILDNWNLIQDLVQKIFVSPYSHLVNELGWLLGNFLNHPSLDVQKQLQKLRLDFEMYESQFAFFKT